MFNLMPYLALIAQQSSDDGGFFAAIFSSFFTFCCVGIFVILAVAGMWKIFTKAGKPGWASIIPIYNFYILLEIIGRPGWWVILYFIPFVNFVVMILVALDLARVFGKSTLFAIGLILFPFIFYLLLGFGDATYQGTGAAKASGW